MQQGLLNIINLILIISWLSTWKWARVNYSIWVADLEWSMEVMEQSGISDGVIDGLSNGR